MAERLTPLDAAFLGFETPAAPMHVGGLLVLDGRPATGGEPDVVRVLRHVRARLASVPRIRQRVLPLPLAAHRPVWVDDPDFDPRRHIRRARLPAPGTREVLVRAAAQLHGEMLPRDRPLWQVTLFEGLDDGSLAIYAKLHHSMVDGLAAVGLALQVFDVDPEAPLDTTYAEPPRGAPLPGRAELLSGALQEQRAFAGAAVRAAARAVPGPAEAWRRLAAVSPGGALGSLASGLRPAPRSPLGIRVGEGRRAELFTVPLAAAKQVKAELGFTVNDVVLAAVAEGLYEFLRHRGPVAAGATHRIAVPVNTRGEADSGALGNRVSAVLVDLPVGPMDPVRRLWYVAEAMGALKRKGSAQGGERLLELTAFLPAPLHSVATRALADRQWLFNLIVSNVPGVQFPLYCAGHRVREIYPLLPLTPNAGVTICVLSYDNRLNFGLVADARGVPDAHVLRRGIESGFTRLLDAAFGRDADEAATGPAMTR